MDYMLNNVIEQLLILLGIMMVLWLYKRHYRDILCNWEIHTEVLRMKHCNIHILLPGLAKVCVFILLFF